MRATATLLVALLLLTGCGDSGKRAFIEDCKQRVGWQLRSPSSARYVPIREVYQPTGNALDGDGYLSNSAATLWVSALDAPNAFGVPLRNYVVCVRAPDGETLVSIIDDLDELRSVIR